MLLTAVIFLAVLGLIVFVHELGHFLAAKRAGMRVEEFGFGFPPKIFGVKRGDTLYSVNWIPLGGFVRIKGENGDGPIDADSFIAKSLPRRIAVILAGVAMNVVLAFVLFTFGYLIGVPQDVSSLPKGAIVSSRSVTIAMVLPGSPADRAGLQAGDAVLALGGAPVSDSGKLRADIKSGSGDVTLRIRRGREEKDMAASPAVLAETGSRGLGVELIDAGNVRFPWYLAPLYGAETTATALASVGLSFWSMVSGLFVGHVPAEVSGPVGIAVVTGQAVKIGFRYLIEFTALLSLNLAVLNVIPFPALDGGRFLFLVIEALRGRAVSRKIEGIAHQAGFALLMIMVLAVTWRDLVRYGGAVTGLLKKVF